LALRSPSIDVFWGRPFIYLVIYSVLFIYSFIQYFIYLFIQYLFIYSVFHLFIYSVGQKSLIYSTVYSVNPWVNRDGFR